MISDRLKFLSLRKTCHAGFERHPCVCSTEGLEIIHATFSELPLINSGTIIWKVMEIWGYKTTTTNKPKLSVSKCHGLCRSLNPMQVGLTVFVIVTVMLFVQCSECRRLCSAGSGTMSTAPAPGPHAADALFQLSHSKNIYILF